MPKLYAKKETVRKYYKYTLNEIILPEMTSNTTPRGTVTGDMQLYGGSQYYNPFFGKNTAINRSSYKTGYNYVRYDFAHLLKAGTYTISFEAYRQGNVRDTNHKWIAICEDGTEIVMWSLAGDIATSYTTYQSTATIDKNIKAIQYSVNASYVGTTGYVNSELRNFCFTQQGKELNTVTEITNIQESTIDDYDFYKDVEVWSTPKETVTKYWKYGDYTATWNQPALNSLTQYGEVVSTYGNNALKIFDNDVDTVYKITGGSQIKWNFPEPLKVSQVRLLGQYVSTKSRETNVIVYTEVDGVETKLATGSGAAKTTTYTSIANIDNVIVDNLIFKWSGFDSTVPPTIREIYITALERSVIEGTPDDYDFTTTQDIYYASIQGD